jgi:hypothetical protein
MLYSAVGAATVAGSLTVIVELAGTTAGSGTVADVRVSSELSGTSAGSTIVADIRSSNELRGETDGLGAVTGAATQVHRITAELDGSTTVTATLLEVEEARALTDGTTVVSGKLTVVTMLAGSSAGAGFVADVRVANNPAGSSAGSAGVSARFTVDLSAASTGSSTVADLRVANELGGSISGEATSMGGLLISAYQELEGGSVGVGTISAGPETGFVSEPWLTLLWRDMPRDVPSGMPVTYSSLTMAAGNSPAPIGRCGSIRLQSIIRPPKSSSIP